LPSGTLTEPFSEATAAHGEATAVAPGHRGRSGALSRRGTLVPWALAGTDCVALTLAFAIAELLFASPSSDGNVPDAITPAIEALLFLSTLPAWLLVAKLFRLYERDQQRTDHSTTDDLVGIVNVVTVGTWLFLSTAWLLRFASPSFPKLLTFWALAIVLLAAGRTVARAFCRRRRAYIQNTVIVGAGDVGQLVARKLLQHPEYGLSLVGLVDSAPKEQHPRLSNVALLGAPEDLPAIVEEHDVERAVFAFWDGSHHEMVELIRRLNDMGVQVDIVPRLFDVVSKGADVHAVESIPLIALPPFRLSNSAQVLKRALDISASFLGLIFLGPFFAVVALLIKLDSPGPVLFRQVRMGRQDRPFHMFKFRTMVVDAEARKCEFAELNVHAGPGGDSRMFKIVDDPRITRVGRLLRRHLCDELPQLINVLKGEMTLVGPRPLILEEDRYVDGWARRRLHLKPGMTGLWQVLGRSAISFEEMVQIDYRYVMNWSLWLDIRLLLRTLPLVLKGGRGAF
jgi:exopolysaccharide biosynthesis polyprenyl glycosylphosphotransferase